MACSQRMVDVTVEENAALEVDDFDRANLAVTAYNAAVDDCNNSGFAFDFSVTELYLAGGSSRGSVEPA